MELKNMTSKSVSKRLPNREWVTLKPSESYDFPDVYESDKRLLAVKVKNVKVVNFDLNNDGVVDKKDLSIAGKVLSSMRKKRKKSRKS